MADGFCDTKCNQRCAKAGRQDRCLKYCGICCKDCRCVPSGTFGNAHVTGTRRTPRADLSVLKMMIYGLITKVISISH
ncbi:hypothetical protein MKX01_039934 [Papaver californicum]|nr:hypothetical protein MKX01_039934 [Papaver californicum]